MTVQGRIMQTCSRVVETGRYRVNLGAYVQKKLSTLNLINLEGVD
jgi:hypothetical protein